MQCVVAARLWVGRGAAKEKNRDGGRYVQANVEFAEGSSENGMTPLNSRGQTVPCGLLLDHGKHFDVFSRLVEEPAGAGRTNLLRLNVLETVVNTRAAGASSNRKITDFLRK